MSSKQGSTFGTREVRWRLDRRRGQDDQRKPRSAVWDGICKRWRERSIGSGGAGGHQPEGVCASIAVTQKRSQTKRWLHEFR